MPVTPKTCSRGAALTLAGSWFLWAAAAADPTRPPVIPGPAPAIGGLSPRPRQSGPPQPDHVVIVMEENYSYSEIIGSSSAPYINALAGQGVLFTNYLAQFHPSEQNYLEIFSGSDQGIGTSDPNPAPGSPFTSPNWGGELIASKLGFVGFSEDLPSTGYSGVDTATWVYRHCPWIAFQGTGTNQIPSGNNVDFSGFPSNSATPNYVSLPAVCMVTPNLQDDMHDGTISQGDTWLKNNLDGYAQWAKTHNSLLIVVWDEDDGSEGNRVPMIIVGQGIQAGTQNSQSLDHDSLCRLICDLFGLTPMAHAAGATAIQGIWSSGGAPGGGGGGPSGTPTPSSGGGAGCGATGMEIGWALGWSAILRRLLRRRGACPAG